MADLCVVYLTEDEAVVERLVEALRAQWSVWWARDIPHGDWELAVRREIDACEALVPVISDHSVPERMPIVRDEIHYALSRDKAVLPFLIGQADMPFGMGTLNRTEAPGWIGEGDDARLHTLRGKIRQVVPEREGGMRRPDTLTIGGKHLRLPAFAFSLSSHETQVSPLDGATLLHELGPDAALVSAYDASRGTSKEERRRLRAMVRRLVRSETLLFLDSGNYEAERKNDTCTPKRNPTGWSREQFHEVARALSPDITFSFDKLPDRGSAAAIASRTVESYSVDHSALGDLGFPICPIVHLPSSLRAGRAEFAEEVIVSVAEELDPIMVAIPERELGDGLRTRARAVRRIRDGLNGLQRYYPLHLLGTGNPLSMAVLAAAGADAFDGLEWCRTVADYDKGYLFHFQHLDLFLESQLTRIRDPRSRLLLQSNDVPFATKALIYNVDFFADWSRTMRSQIHSGQAEYLLRNVPHVGRLLFEDLSR